MRRARRLTERQLRARYMKLAREMDIAKGRVQPLVAKRGAGKARVAVGDKIERMLFALKT